MADEEISDIDPRLQFIFGYLMRSMKLKFEKWQKMLTIDECKKVVYDFLDKVSTRMLFFSLSSGGVLQVTSSFPSHCKTKSVYFIKKKTLNDSLQVEDNVQSHLIYGDLCHKPIDQLSVLTEEVFLPMLSNPYVKKHVNDLKNSVNQVRGLLNGQIILAMPDGIENVAEVERRIIESEGEDVNLEFKSAIEGAVIKWAAQINDVIQEQSFMAFNREVNPTPSFEIQFWTNRLKNLESIYDQLKDERVQKMASILEHTDSAYFTCFKTLYKNVVGAVAEARSILNYLKAVIQELDKMEFAEFNHIEPLLRSMMHVVCLVWANCKYYQCDSKIIVLLKEINNHVINLANRHLDPATIFEGKMSETLVKVSKTIGTLKRFKTVFEKCRTGLKSFFRNLEPGESPTLWTFHPKLIFQRYDAYIGRLEVIENFFKTALEYDKIGKISIGGLMGRILGDHVAMIYDEYIGCLNVFATISYDPCDPDDDSFLKDYERFSEQILDMDRRLASALSLAVDDCPDIEHDFNMVKSLFNAQLEYYQIHKKIMVDNYYPPVAGAIGWLNVLKRRIAKIQEVKEAREENNFNEPRNEIAEELSKLQTDLDTLGEQLFKKWTEDLVLIEKKCMEQTLFKINKDGRLIVNFDRRLEAHLRELRYLNLAGKYDDFPDKGKELFNKIEYLGLILDSLQVSIAWYNEVKYDTREEELNLIERELHQLDHIMHDLLNETWNSETLWEDCQVIRYRVGLIHHRVHQARINVLKIREIAEQWNENALYTREGTAGNPGLLDLKNGMKECRKRNNEIQKASKKIQTLLERNFNLYYPPEPYNKHGKSSNESFEDPDEEEGKSEDDQIDMDASKANGDFKDDTSEEGESVKKSESKINFTWTKKYPKHLEHNETEDNLTTELDGEMDKFKEEDEEDESEINSEERKEGEQIITEEILRIIEDMTTQQMINVRLSHSGIFDPQRKSKWYDYLDYVDSIVMEGILNAIGLSLIYISEELHQTGGLVTPISPLFRVWFSFSLNKPELVFTPALVHTEEDKTESLYSQVNDIIEDILNMGRKMLRVSKRTEKTYTDDILNNCKIINEMIQVIVCSVQQVTTKVLDYTGQFMQYNHLWLEDRQVALENFLTYGRLLTPVETENVGKVGDDGHALLKEIVPTDEDFKKAITYFENIRESFLKQMDEKTKIFDDWLLLDINPFKKSFLILVCHWVEMFKHHLVVSVMASLHDLKDFLDETEEGLTTPLVKGDYESLVKILTYVQKVREREVQTDMMFKPLVAIIKLLKHYNQDFPEATYLMLQELPKRWENMKKKVSKKQAVAQPLIAKESPNIKHRVALLDVRQNNYKENFKHKCFFQWNCTDPYREIDKAKDEMNEMENTLNKLKELARVFQLQKPDEKALINAKKELKMAKLVWDNILVIQGWIENWRDTLWQDIDAEDMDMKLNKFANELQMLNKDIHDWEIFVRLENEIKNIIADLKKVTELEDPIIQEYSWKELMAVTDAEPQPPSHPESVGGDSEVIDA